MNLRLIGLLLAVFALGYGIVKLIEFNGISFIFICLFMIGIIIWVMRLWVNARGATNG